MTAVVTPPHLCILVVGPAPTVIIHPLSSSCPLIFFPPSSDLLDLGCVILTNFLLTSLCFRLLSILPLSSCSPSSTGQLQFSWFRGVHRHQRVGWYQPGNYTITKVLPFTLEHRYKVEVDYVCSTSNQLLKHIHKNTFNSDVTHRHTRYSLELISVKKWVVKHSLDLFVSSSSPWLFSMLYTFTVLYICCHSLMQS